MKIKKTINHLANATKDLTEKEAQAYFLKLIEDYEHKINYGSKDKLEAFNNAVYTPRIRIKPKKQDRLKMLMRRKNSPKAQQIYKFLYIIYYARKEGRSAQKIANELNDIMVKYYRYGKNRKPYFNRQYLYDTCLCYDI